MKYVAMLVLFGGGLQLSGIAAAQALGAGLGLVVYPSEGQASNKQAQDEGECYQWARTNTGVDPANPSAGVQAQQAPAQPPPGAVAAGGAARGAATGALIGEIADEDRSEYAAAGALIGGMRSAKRAKQQQAQAQQQTAASTQAQTQERMQLFKNAFAACMEGRKYTVK